MTTIEDSRQFPMFENDTHTHKNDLKLWKVGLSYLKLNYQVLSMKNIITKESRITLYSLKF